MSGGGDQCRAAAMHGWPAAVQGRPAMMHGWPAMTHG
jgi:hypothetical protein